MGYSLTRRRTFGGRSLVERDELEWKTRRERIDPKLKAAGWAVARGDQGTPLPQAPTALTELPTHNGPADYACTVGGRLVGVAEAKKVGTEPQEVLKQAERYARGLNGTGFDANGYGVPFLYSTNGEIIWFRDVRHPLNVQRRITRFHTPGAIEEMLSRDLQDGLNMLGTLPTGTSVLRDYQWEAVTAIEDAIAARKRQMLVAMATGTGKTRLMVNQIYRLMKAGIAKRVLFLVDRRALAAQAVREFGSCEAEPGLKFTNIYEVYSQRFQSGDFGEEDKFDPSVLPQSYLTDPTGKEAFVYVSTIQRMAINLFGRGAAFGGDDEDEIQEDENQLDIPIHAFDLIVADECHRGYTSAELSVWRNTLDHFDAIKIGLTATPAAHTKTYFTEVVFRYEYERAVREGHLVDYNVVAVESDVKMNGVFLEAGANVGEVDPKTGVEQLDRLEDERQYDATEVERKITSPDSNRKVLQELKKYAHEHEQRYGRFPKTLIFAVHDMPHTSHASQIVRLAREVFGGGDDYVQKITGKVDRPLQHIREFRNRPKPAIVVTVDLLSTGIDIKDLEYIVFMRPVKSRILFEQMLGRGTRTGDWYAPDKSHFTVFDCFGGRLIEYFRNATAITFEPPDKPSRTIAQIIEDIWQNRDRDYNVRCLVKRLQRIDKEMSGEARDLFAAFVADGDVGRYARELSERLRRDFAREMLLLRSQPFQDLLVNYSRPPRTFTIGYDVEDMVTSQFLIKGADGKEYKPEDYLVAFERFVCDNPDQVEAIRVLLDRPGDWSTDALGELRMKLTRAPQRFTVDNLERVHKEHYGKALVDIISMVKHAADEKHPLLTAEERVRLAVVKVSAGRDLTTTQRAWLERIREHLVQNLSISKDDFDLVQVLDRAGGWGAANKAFDGQLAVLLRELNEAVAA